MICFDTNVIIYIANGTLSENVVGDEVIAYASIARIEALGYANIRSIEETRIKELLATITEIPLSEPIIEMAVRLRQIKHMTLGDAIVAATALAEDCELWTANIKDFAHINGLRLRNPLAESN